MLNTIYNGSVRGLTALILINCSFERFKSKAMEAENENEYNPWAFFPIHLSPEEINAPLSVIAAFFDDDRLPGQLAMLKEWRDSILKPNYYRGPKNSPSSLLYFHKLNIALIEAMYLLNQNGGADNLNLPGAEPAKEKNSWIAYPVYLGMAELADPFLFLQGFFLAYTLPHYRQHLAGWLEHGLSRYPAGEFIGAVELITVYENLQKLYEAAWLIHQRFSGRPYLKMVLGDKGAGTFPVVTTDQPTGVTLYQLDKDIGLVDIGLLPRVVNVITHKVPSVQAVIYLGCPQVKQSPLFLLVLIDNKEREQAQALAATIEESCRALASVIALVHHASALLTATKHDNLFFSNALTCHVIYLSGELLLPTKPLTTTSKNDQTTTDLWERWKRQGIDFLDGAGYHLEKGAANAALFCLQQCVECLLIAMIRAVTGYRINNHNISKLLNLTQMFTTDLTEVFDLDNHQSKELFSLLKHAYVNVRYKDSFEADIHSVHELYPIAQQFVNVTDHVYHKHLLTSSI